MFKNDRTVFGKRGVCKQCESDVPGWLNAAGLCEPCDEANQMRIADDAELDRRIEERERRRAELDRRIEERERRRAAARAR